VGQFWNLQRPADFFSVIAAVGAGRLRLRKTTPSVMRVACGLCGPEGCVGGWSINVSLGGFALLRITPPSVPGPSIHPAGKRTIPVHQASAATKQLQCAVVCRN